MTINQALNEAIGLHKAGNIAAAKRLLSRIIQIEPNQPDANHNMGRLLFESRNLKEALPFFKTALEANYGATQYWFSYIDALFRLDRFSEASELLAIAKDKGCEGPEFDDLAEKLNASMAEIETGIQGLLGKIVDGPNAYLSHFEVGVAFQRRGKFEEATTAYNKALSLKPDYAEAYCNMGLALADQGKLEKAMEAYNKALSLKPDFAEAYNNMGNSLKDQGKLEEATAAYNKALSLKPDYAEAYNNIGIALQLQGKLEEAIEACNKALSLKPDYAEVYNTTGNILKDQGKFDESAEAYNKALSIKHDHTLARRNLAILLFESNHYEKSAELFSKDVSIESQNYLLKCFYEQIEKEKFSRQLDYLIERGENNAVIGSYISRSEYSFGINRNNPFCNKPLNYVSKIDLNKKCDFKKIFVENATDVLKNDLVKHRDQGLLTNGIQTAGNIFTQVGFITEQWQSIIRSELAKYKEHFCESEEGFIKDWPSDYSIYGWLVSMNSGGKLAAHIHDTGWITGSIYINVPPKSKKDSGNLVVTTDNEKHKNAKIKNRKSIDVATGSLCLFPSSLLHYTMPFEADEDRIVLAFDVNPK
jgi:tetratricopeptide (TPR) repeat protein